MWYRENTIEFLMLYFWVAFEIVSRVPDDGTTILPPMVWATLGKLVIAGFICVMFYRNYKANIEDDDDL